jgi:hypothetical protein
MREKLTSKLLTLVDNHIKELVNLIRFPLDLVNAKSEITFALSIFKPQSFKIVLTPFG